MSVKGDPNRPVSVQHEQLHVPPLDEMAEVLSCGLKKNYKESSCVVADCPDLSKEPFQLAAPGICGKTRLADVGGVPYLIPNSQYMEKVYDLQNVGEVVGLPGGYVVGAGAGSKHVVGTNCEMMPNFRCSGGQFERNNQTHIARVNTADQSHVLESYDNSYNSCSEFCLLANLFYSEGKRGKVLEVRAKSRTGNSDLVNCLRETLKEFYGEPKPVGLGGVFLVKAGRIKIHVMPDFSETPLTCEEDVNNWLNFYEASAPFVCFSTSISADPGLDLRVEHTHGYSLANREGGHYHTDTTPDEVEYLGYFVPAEAVYRLDRPAVTHMIGRD